MSKRSICLCDHCVKFRMGIKIALVYGQRWSGKECRCLYKEGDGRAGGFVLGDTGKVKDDKEKKHFSIETLIGELIAVETMTTVLMGLAMVMCRVVIN